MKVLYNYLVILSYSLLFIPIWGLLLLSADIVSNSSIFVALIYTIIGSYYVRNSSIYMSTKYAEYLVYLGPLVYIISMFTMMPTNFATLFHPIVWATTALIISQLLIKKIDTKVLVFALFIAYLYGFHIHSYWESIYKPTMPTQYIEKKDLAKNIKLSDFEFTTSDNETTIIKTDKPFVLIETWNEACVPCIEAMKDLQPLFLKNKDKVAHYYLYEQPTDTHKLTATDVFNYPNINDKSQILIDENLQFFNTTGMKSYPYFLLFNKNGDLVDYFKAYDHDNKDYFENRLQNMWSK